MKLTTARKLIENELYQLDVQPDSDAWGQIYNQAMDAAEILSAKEIRQLIAEYLELLPLSARY